MSPDELRGMVNQGVEIEPFPHEWNKFKLLAVENGSAVFHKCSNHQRFEVPVANITAVGFAAPGEWPKVFINAPVRWEPDRGGYGSIWVV